MSYKHKKKASALDSEAKWIFRAGVAAPLLGIVIFLILRWKPATINSDTGDQTLNAINKIFINLADLRELVLILTTLFAAYMVFRAKESHEVRNQASAFFTKIQEDLEQIRSHQTYGEVVSQDDIYARKTECIRKCMKIRDLSHMNYAISLTSFRPDSPRDSTNPDVQLYHDELERYLRDYNVSVRRLINIPTVRKAIWVKDLAKLNKHRFEVRLYAAPEGSPKPLTVDIYGKEHVFVTFWNHNDHATHVYFVSEKIRTMFESYYESIWVSQEVIIRPVLSDEPALFEEKRLDDIISLMPCLKPKRSSLA